MPKGKIITFAQILHMSDFSSVLLENAVVELSKLPGIGKKTALRLAIHLLNEDASRTEMLAKSIVDMRQNIKLCERCFNISDTDRCSICSNPKRDSRTLCVVADMRDVLAIERTSSYNGLYHVLGGIISPIDGVRPEDLKISQLINRSKSEEIDEIILALPATIEGDTTNYYIYRLLSEFKGRVSVIAKGISVGDALEYADEVTLGRSIMNRTPYKM